MSVEDNRYSYEKYNALLQVFTSPPFRLVSTKLQEKTKCVGFGITMGEDIVTRTDHSIRDTFHMYRNVLPSRLQQTDHVQYFTYVMDEMGLVLGRIHNSLEWGTAHQMLVEKPESPVYIAGEIRMTPPTRYAPPVLEFNFESGTFSRELKLSSDPELQAALEDVMTRLFSMYHVDDTPPHVVYTSDILLPVMPFTPDELDTICRMYPDRLFRVPGQLLCSDKKRPKVDAIIHNEENNICRHRNDAILFQPRLPIPIGKGKGKEKEKEEENSDAAEATLPVAVRKKRANGAAELSKKGSKTRSSLRRTTWK